MKNNYPIFRKVRIALKVICLLLISHYSISQNGTVQAGSRLDVGTTPYIVRDLMDCDLIKQKSEIQQAYISSLVRQVSVYPDSLAAERKQTVKYKGRSKRRGKAVSVLVIIDLLAIAIIKLAS